MKYLVTNQPELFDSELYQRISVEKALELLESFEVCQLDTETRGLDVHSGELWLTQFGNRRLDIQIAVDCATISIKCFKSFLERKDVLFIIHNAKFDLRWFFKEHIVITNVYDTFLAEKILYLGYPPGIISLSLQACCKRYLGVEMDKSVRGEIYKGLTERVVIYGCTDVMYLEDIRDRQLEEITKRGQLRALKIENQFVVVLAYIEYCGIKLDPVRWRAKMQKDQDRLEKAQAALDQWVIEYGDPEFLFTDLQGDLFSGYAGPRCAINWNSPSQVIPLFEKLGFNLWAKNKKTGKMGKSTDSKLIRIQEHISSISKPYLEYSAAFKVVSAFGQNFIDAINPNTKRIHPTFSQMMDTGRLSCGKGGKEASKGKDSDVAEESIPTTQDEDKSVNIQQIPADDDTRAAFVPEEGYLLIDSDYGDQEGHVFTELSQDEKWIEFYNDPNPRDGHGFVAKMCFPDILKDVDELKVKEERKDLRAHAKSARFCFNYNGSAETAAKSINIPVEFAREIYKNYFQNFSGIAQYFKKQKKDMWDRGYILISEFTGLRAHIYDWSTLKGIERRINSEGQDFWANYRAAKASGEIQENIPASVLQEVYKRFADNYTIEEIATSYTYQVKEGKEVKTKMCVVNSATVYTQVYKHLNKRRSSSENQSCNYPSQGTAAAMSKIAGIRYFRHLVEDGLIFTVKIPNMVHDEYLVEAPIEMAEQEAQVLKEHMEYAAKIFCKSVTIHAEPQIGICWIH